VPHASLTRRVRFTARHRFWNSKWSEAENVAVFGASAKPAYHGHDYWCEVTVRGELPSKSGMIVDLGELDRVLDHEVRDRFDQKTINEDVPEFGDGGLAPSGENLARFIYERVRAALGAKAEVTEVVVAEDETLRSAFGSR
jgi:6-pyruvoyltetrahydropterin/6-carboxytetrahydropterin synthase